MGEKHILKLKLLSIDVIFRSLNSTFSTVSFFLSVFPVPLALCSAHIGSAALSRGLELPDRKLLKASMSLSLSFRCLKTAISLLVSVCMRQPQFMQTLPHTRAMMM